MFYFFYSNTQELHITEYNKMIEFFLAITLMLYRYILLKYQTIMIIYFVKIKKNKPNKHFICNYLGTYELNLTHI